MKVCIVAEGCYPYVTGGVSSWIHVLIKKMPEVEFAIQTIIVDRKDRGKFKYQLPENVTEVREIFLNDKDWLGKTKRYQLNDSEREALRGLIFDRDVEWNKIFDLFHENHLSVNELIMGEEFFQIVLEYYKKKYSRIVFTDFLWTMRSMFLPMFLVLKNKPIQADLYHSVATGYAGLWASMASYVHDAPLIVSEHGIYTREREEEIIKANWVKGIYKDIWIEQFNKFSRCSYQHADQVISLFEAARQLEIELGCPIEKTQVIPNGIDIERFRQLPKKEENDPYINVGSVLRVAPVKDVKTMIYAFYYAKQEMDSLKLWIMGPTDENPEYAKECMDIVKSLGLKDVVFTGTIDVKEYLGKMDLFLLTSISEGQPLSILEAFSAGVPCIATNVGNCKGLIEGEIDDFGPAGRVAHVMNISEIAREIVVLAKDALLRKTMGEAGRKRVSTHYREEQFIESYKKLYRDSVPEDQLYAKEGS